MKDLVLASVLLSVAFFCSGAEANDQGDADAKRLAAPIIPDAEECRDRIELPFAPTYPGAAMASGPEGWVVVAFTLSSDGKVIAPRVESEKPAGTFGQSALEAIGKVGFRKAAGTRKCRILSTFTLTQPAARESTALYCDGRFMLETDSQIVRPAGALLMISANDFSLDIEGFGHGKATGKLKRANAFELSGPVLFTPSAPATDAFEAMVVVQKYSGMLELRIPGDTSLSRVRYAGECAQKQPLVDIAD
ncbi:MAG: TonB family protein [Dokdonella sp.]|uniref:TonB family protein n=2 Tax=Dokdonella sp. TaxID=2291710 RepID=UPI003BB147D0